MNSWTVLTRANSLVSSESAKALGRRYGMVVPRFVRQALADQIIRDVIDHHRRAGEPQERSARAKAPNA